jgi:hypothetical protein
MVGTSAGGSGLPGFQKNFADGGGSEKELGLRILKAADHPDHQVGLAVHREVLQVGHRERIAPEGAG